MFITGVKGPGGRVTWFTGAAPSGCGKTTTAMAGDYFVGDDLAQMWVAHDGTVRSINPECGIFGIIEDVNWSGDPKLMEVLRQQGTEVIWSNVLIDSTGVPHWTGNGEEPPESGVNFQGEWKRGAVDTNGKPVPDFPSQRPCHPVFDGFGQLFRTGRGPRWGGNPGGHLQWTGQRHHAAGLGGQDCRRGGDHRGMYRLGGDGDRSGGYGRQAGPHGPMRRSSPVTWGIIWEAQFQFFGSPTIRDDKKPLLAGLNYFLTHEARGGNSKKLLGEKRDVKVWLAWLERRAHNDVEAIETPMGFLPKYPDLRDLFAAIIHKEYTEELYCKQFSLYVDKIVARIDLQMTAYGKDSHIPLKLLEILRRQKEELLSLKNAYGAVVEPYRLLAAHAPS